MKKIYWRLFIVGLSLKWMFKNRIGDEVMYNGKKYVLGNGAYIDAWDIREHGQKSIRVKISDFKKIRSLKNYIHDVTSGYQFYMGYWYSIWVDQGIKPWMKNCRIW